MSTETTSLEDKLYDYLLTTPLGAIGADRTFPALKSLLGELRGRRFWEEKRARRLDEQMIRAWANYRRDLRELRERLRQRNQDQDELLSFLVVFLVEHADDFARVSAFHESKYQLALDTATRCGLPPANDLASRDDWQAWSVAWLREALRDGDLDADAALPASGSSSGGDDNGGPELRPTPKPDSDDDAPGLEF